MSRKQGVDREVNWTQGVGMTINLFAALVAIVGLLTFLISNNGTLKQIGFGCFVGGLAAALVALGGNVVRLR